MSYQRGRPPRPRLDPSGYSSNGQPGIDAGIPLATAPSDDTRHLWRSPVVFFASRDFTGGSQLAEGCWGMRAPPGPPPPASVSPSPTSRLGVNPSQIMDLPRCFIRSEECDPRGGYFIRDIFCLPFFDICFASYAPPPGSADGEYTPLTTIFPPAFSSVVKDAPPGVRVECGKPPP